PLPLIPATATPAVLGDMHREYRGGCADALSFVLGHYLLASALEDGTRGTGPRHVPRAHPALATAALWRYGGGAIGRPARGIAGPLPANRSVAAIGTVHALSIRSRPVTARSPSG